MRTTNSSFRQLQNIVEDAPLIIGLTAMLVMGAAICMLIAWCKLFKKAGLPWERVFVPFYGGYWQFKIANCQNIFWGMICTGFVSGLIAGFTGSPNVAAIFGGIASLVFFVLYCVYCTALAKSFGHGGGFAFGLVVLHPIFIMILGFGSSVFVGTSYAAPAAAAAPVAPIAPAAPVSPAVPAAKGWTCEKCQAVNAGHRLTCEKCGEFKPKSAF